MLLRLFILITCLQVTHVTFSQARIITTGSALTETVYALGDCDKINASDHTSLYPVRIQKMQIATALRKHFASRPASRNYSFRYLYQRDGTTNLEATE